MYFYSSLLQVKSVTEGAPLAIQLLFSVVCNLSEARIGQHCLDLDTMDLTLAVVNGPDRSVGIRGEWGLQQSREFTVEFRSNRAEQENFLYEDLTTGSRVAKFLTQPMQEEQIIPAFIVQL